MRWWPVRGKRRRRAAPESELTAATVTTQPATLQTQAHHAEPQSFQRPNNIVGLVSDLTRSPRQCVMFIVLVGSIVLIATGCVVVVMAAIKGLNIDPLRVMLAGIPSASFLAVLGSLIRWCIKKRGKGGDRG